jgi:RNA polymerase sigma factor (sigma-70 family)
MSLNLEWRQYMRSGAVQVLDQPIGFGDDVPSMSRLVKPLPSRSDAGTDPDPLEPPDELRGLALAAARGDGGAAASLMVHVGSSMLIVVRKVLGRSVDVDDVVQDAVVGLIQGLPAFRGDCSVAHFARRVALLTALAARRRKRLRAQLVEIVDEPIDELPDGGDLTPLDVALANRRRAIVGNLLDELPQVIAEALALHFLLGYTVDEIAATEEVSPHTVWSRLRLGKKALRRRLAGDTSLTDMLRVNR